MSYTDIDTLKKAFNEKNLIRLSNDDGSATALNEDVVNDIILQVDEEINAYLRVRYSLPLVSNYSDITRIANTLVFFRLKQRKNEASEQDGFFYEDAKKTLKAYADGKISLEGQTIEESSFYCEGDTFTSDIDDVSF